MSMASCRLYKHKLTEGIQELFVQGTKTYEFPMEKTRGENISLGGKKRSFLYHSFIPSIEEVKEG